MAKVMVSMPEELLAEIDRVAKETGRTRSGLLQHIWRLYMLDRLSRTRPGDRPGVREAIEKAQRTFLSAPVRDERDSTQIIREMRDSRWGQAH